MHKTHPQTASRHDAPGRVVRIPKKRRNRKRRNWDRLIRRVCGIALVAEVAILLFANPHLYVTHVRINGLKTLSTQQVFAEARVPSRTNIFWMALRRPFAAGLRRDPVIDHVTCSLQLPRTLVLNVTERRPYATLTVADESGVPHFWLLDRKGIAFRVFDAPPRGVPLLEWEGAAPGGLALGRPLTDPRLAEAYTLMTLVRGKKILGVQKIKVDQNANLCLNSTDNLQIKLGQPDALPEKIALAQAAVGWRGGALARRAASLDVSSPEQPVYTLRTDLPEEGASPDGGDRPDSDRSRTSHGYN